MELTPVRTLLGGTLILFLISVCVATRQPVTGVVKIEGIPTNGAWVFFFSAGRDPDKIQSHHSVGECTENGRFELTGADGIPGIPDGEYLVAVSVMKSKQGKFLIFNEYDEDLAVEAFPLACCTNQTNCQGLPKLLEN